MLKKLLFAPFVLVFLYFALFKYKLALDQYLEVFLGQWGGLYDLGIITIFIILTALFFCLFVTFTQNLKYAFPLILVTAILPFLFFSTGLAMVIAVSISLCFLLGYYNLETNLKTYFNFRPDSLIAGPVRMLSTLILFSLSVGFYMHSNLIIQTQGFKIPDPLLDWAIDLSLTGIPVKGEKYLAQINLTPEQAEQLKQNPAILESFGLEPSDVDQFVQEDSFQTTETSAPTGSIQKSISQNPNAVAVIPSIPGVNIKDIVKAQISDSLDQIVKPYLPIIPFILALLFYSVASLAMFVIFLFLSPLITLIFSILDKTGFVKYEKEMREVKKMVV